MKKVLLLIGIIMFSILPSLASENVLQTIEIEPAKDSYNIVLVSDKAVDVKKNVQDTNKITLTMKDIRASKTLNTVYNNVSNVDTVLVEPQGNGLSIYFQAENAEKAIVTFDSLVAPAPTSAKSETQKLKLNNPIESYAPIYNEEFKSEKTTNIFDRIKKSQAADSIKDSIDEDTADDIGHKVMSYGLLIVFAVVLLKLFKRKESGIKIGLTQSMNDREIGMYRGPQPSTINNVEKPFTTVNYGLNAYQRGNANPYETSPIQYHNPKLRNYSNQIPQSSTLTQETANYTQTATVAQPQLKKYVTATDEMPTGKSNPNIDNLKFLESMTAIYEKSGRHDLARGLKASLIKNNQ